MVLLGFVSSSSEPQLLEGEGRRVPSRNALAVPVPENCGKKYIQQPTWMNLLYAFPFRGCSATDLN